MNLLEVLAAIGVLSIGLLGLAALLPVGRYTIGEATKADRAGQCGRAALHDVIIRGMLNPNNWVNTKGGTVDPRPNSFVIDPRGVAQSPPLGPFGGLTRISLANANTQAEADYVFIATDDLVVPLPEDFNPPQAVGRPQNLSTTGGKKPVISANPLKYAGWYSWLVTVVPQSATSTCFTVSVAVCFQRNFKETTATIASNAFYDNGLGGGSVMLSSLSGPFQVKENDWIALCGTNATKPIPSLCRWYRVAAVGDDGVSLTLVGPDWDTSYATTAVALGQSVLGVYTTTVNLDTDPTWTAN